MQACLQRMELPHLHPILHRYNTFQKHRGGGSFTLVCQFGVSVTATGPAVSVLHSREDATHSLLSCTGPHLKQVKASCRDLLLLCDDLGGDIRCYVMNMLAWMELPPTPKPSRSLGIRVGIQYRDYISYSTALIIKEEEDHNSTLAGSLSFNVVRIPVLDSRCFFSK
ncbi:unnamed protein product [Cuscuta campestris]|uniref:Uncharacterized protein n=1 Tax=Cuscuta campestris TaxID=132261 RepID=A0A484N2C7_9ASTE|nr:unnamed protein product [Cuscuta campestris]